MTGVGQIRIPLCGQLIFKEATWLPFTQKSYLTPGIWLVADVAVSDIFEELSLLKYPETILYKALSRVKLHSRYSILSST